MLVKHARRTPPRVYQALPLWTSGLECIIGDMMRASDDAGVRLLTPSATQTRRLGACLASLLIAGDLILLQGPFGAGKTVFTQGIGCGLGIDEPVTSPSFTLVNEYRRGTRLPLFHIDLYRVDSPAEALDIGLDEYVEGGGVTVVEWPDRVEAALPMEHLLVRFTVSGSSQRELTFGVVGERYATLLAEFLSKCGGRHRRAPGN
jgi:tRNA threonylcarbamoyladenosine biosynthesis protein TsaE